MKLWNMRFESELIIIWRDSVHFVHHLYFSFWRMENAYSEWTWPDAANCVVVARGPGTVSMVTGTVRLSTSLYHLVWYLTKLLLKILSGQNVNLYKIYTDLKYLYIWTMNDKVIQLTHFWPLAKTSHKYTESHSWSN